MENASKALIIAGGILIAIIIISLGVRMFVNLNKSSETYSAQPETADLQMLNAKFETYIGKTNIKPQEIITLYNFIEDNKNKYPHQVKLTVIGDTTYPANRGFYK